MNWHVRRTNLEDLETIAELDEQIYVLEKPWSYQEFLDCFNEETGVFFTAVSDTGQIIGYSLYNMLTKTQAELLANTVVPQYRGLGIGKALLEARLNHIDANPRVKKTILQTRTDNDIVIKLYKKYGFDFNKVLKNYYRPGVDAFEMVRSSK